MNIENFDQEVAELESLEPELPELIPVTLLPSKKNGFYKQLNLGEHTVEYKLQKGRQEIKFKSPVFVEDLSIHTKETSKAIDCVEILVKAYADTNYKSIRLKEYADSSAVYAEINDVVDSIVIKADYSIWDRLLKIKGIDIHGYDKNGFSAAVAKVGEWLLKKNYIKEGLSADRDKITRENSILDERKVKVDAEFSEIKELIDVEKATYKEQKLLSDELIRLNGEETNKYEVNSAKNKEASERVKDLEGKSERLVDSINQKEAEAKGLNEDIAANKKKLSELLSKKSLFTEEIEAYSKRGTSNIVFYTFLYLIPLGVFLFVTYELFDNSKNMLDLYKEQTKYSVIDIMASRLPFVFVSIFLIQASYYIAKAFFMRIIEIHRDRLNLSRILIVANDVSEASLKGLDQIDDETKYHLKTKLKMDVLRSHLANDLDNNFKYMPEDNFENAIKSPVGKLIESILKRSDKEHNLLKSKHDREL